MEVTRRSVNSKPGLSAARQNQIRSAVHHSELAFLRGEIIEFDIGSYAQTLDLVHLFARVPSPAKRKTQTALTCS
ncbi:Uncharacterised protein [Yersinia intermedia]|nr:Uncharacterised protein [Yersinia intermedia]